MARARPLTSWLPRAGGAKRAGELPTGDALRNEWIDFDRGIRVGNLEPHERITQILKYQLEQRHGTPFVTDRYGRGVFWQWICWLPRANRQAKPVSHDTNFGCAKLYIMADDKPREFQCGLQVERGYVRAPKEDSSFILQRDWDWHRLAAQFRCDSPLDAELQRLIGREDFVAAIGHWESRARFDKGNFKSARQLRDALRRCSDREWAGFQLYYPMSEKEVRACSGRELTGAMVAAFEAVVPAMNLFMQVELVKRET
jgi:hypothetical protein